MSEPKCRAEHTDRTGLYILVMIAVWSSCHNGDKLTEIQSQLDSVIHPQSAEAPHPPTPQNPASR